MSSRPNSVSEGAMLLVCTSVRPARWFVHSFIHLDTWYLMNGLSNLNDTYREYSLAPADDLIRSGGQMSRSQQAIDVAEVSTLVQSIEVHLVNITDISCFF